MKNFPIIIFCFLLFSGCSSKMQTVNVEDSSSDEQLIQVVTKEYAAALTNRDVSTIERIFADNGSFSTYVDGALTPVTKKKYLEIMPTKFVAWDSAGYIFENALKNLKIEGSSATGLITMSYTSTSYNGADEFAAKFVKKDSGWKLMEVLPN